MFYSRNASLSFRNYSASGCRDDIFRKSVNHRLSLKIHSFKFISMVFRRWHKTRGYIETCMQAFTYESELSV